jgi:hypothetical protein
MPRTLLPRLATAWLPAIALIGCLLLPALARAESDPEPSMFSYGFNGFWTGASIGLAVGYLSTGGDYESNEWKKLVMGAGIGALTGVGAGIGLAVADIGAPGRGTGWYVLRDINYGSLLGALTGAAVGALVWLDDGTSKDVLVGLSIGALIGAGVGIGFGIYEGMNAGKHARLRAQNERGLHLLLSAWPGSRGAPPSVLSGVQGRF